jgi:hypothetical protein
MGDLAAWLGAIHKTCTELLGPLDDDYGVDTVEDMLLLDSDDVKALTDTLKKVPAKKFRAALEALALDAALPGDAAGAGPKSIPEAVPPGKSATINLHTVGQQPMADEDVEDACAPEPELLPSPPTVTSPKPNRTSTSPTSAPATTGFGFFPKGGGFGSMRFDGVVPGHAQELKQGMNALGADINIINMTGGGDIDLAVQKGILEADAFIVFGSKKYGEDTGNAACTYYESKFAQSQKKKIILIRMIPFGEEFEFPQAKFMFGLNMLELPWMLGTPMPPDLPRQVVEAMAGALSPASAAAAAPAPAPPPEDPLLAALAASRDRDQSAAAQAEAAREAAEREARVRAQLEEALIEPEELIWRRYSGGAERMGREGYSRFAEEVCGWQGTMSDGAWQHNATNCGGNSVDGIDRAGFFQGEYISYGRDAAADTDALADEAALRALVAEAAACGTPVRGLREALEARMAEAALMRPLWTASASQLVDILVGQHGDVDTVKRCCRQLQQRLAGQPANKDAAEKVGCSKALVAALQAHSSDAAVQQWGCLALANLVCDHPANQTAAAAAGGLEAAVAALRAHPGAAAVQDRGCFALGNLVDNHPANRTAAAAAGGLEAAVAALRAHPGAAAVQDRGCYALAHLAWCHPANKAAAVRAGAIDLAEAARARFAAETRAHKNAVAALKLLR